MHKNDLGNLQNEISISCLYFCLYPYFYAHFSFLIVDITPLDDKPYENMYYIFLQCVQGAEDAHSFNALVN